MSPINAARTPLRIESSPSVGPTVRSSTILSGTGNEPARKTIVMIFASEISFIPVIRKLNLSLLVLKNQILNLRIKPFS